MIAYWPNDEKITEYNKEELKSRLMCKNDVFNLSNLT